MCGGSGIGEIESKAPGDEGGMGVCRSHGEPNEEHAEELPVLSQPAKRRNNNVFFSEDGLRSGWRLAIYLLIVGALATAITLPVVRTFGQPRGVPSVFAMMLQEFVGFAVVFGAAAV